MARFTDKNQSTQQKIGASVKRGAIFVCAFLMAFSTVEAGLLLALQQKVSAQSIEAQDTIKAITQQGRAPKPLESAAEKSRPSQQGVVAQNVREQAKVQPEVRPGEQPAGLASSLTSTELTEDTGKRTTNSKTYTGKRGEKSVEYFNQDIAYKNGKDLKELGSTVKEDQAYKEHVKSKRNWFENALPWNEPRGYTGEDGPVKASFEILQKDEGIKVALDGKEITMQPQNANQGIVPESKRNNDVDTITYRNVWDGVDLIYEYRGDVVKEYIVLNKQPKSSQFAFKFSGNVTLQKGKDGVIDVLKDGKPVFVLPPLSVIAQEKGPVSDSGVKYSIKGDTVTVSVDSKWLNKQEQKHYPIVIDPAVESHYAWYEITNYNQYYAYKSDGYNCSPSNCFPNVGWLNDNGTKVWRSMMRIPFDAAVGKDLQAAQLNFYKANSPYWTGTNNNARYWVTWAPCFGYGCVNGGAPWMPITVGTEGHADIKPLLDWMIQNGQTGGWLMVHGDDSPYKALDPYNATIQMWYNRPPAAPAKISPAAGQVITTTMPQLNAGTVADPDGDGVSYAFHLYNGSSFVASSGALAVPRWTVPEGLLEDGGTYTWYAASMDPWKWTWSTPTSFNVDMRTGKDKTQTYDDVGPISANLADGNVYTSTSSHSISALGGSIGVGLDYNTPSKSVKGLSATYYNDTGGRRTVLTRTDPNIDFEWAGQSPKPGTVDSDNFAVNWQGYFVAPQTGTYKFGGNFDDVFSMSIDTNRNGQYQTQFDFVGGQGPWSGTTVNLVAGQVYPINTWFIEHGGWATARLLVRTPDGQERAIPQDWLRTSVKPVVENQGMQATYYKDLDNSRQFKADQQPFLTQRYGTASINWGSGSPMGYDPDGYFKDNFLIRLSGYLTVPVTGNYRFGSGADDGQRVYVNGNKVADMWSDHGYAETWSGWIPLQAGQVVPITVEYYENGGGAQVNLQWDGPAGAGIVGPEYMTTSYKSLPAGWNLSIDADGNLPYERLRVAASGNVNLIDGDGTVHTYLAAYSSYKPPVNEDGHLVRNSDGSFTLSDSDGRVYQFSADGALRSVTTPTDDRKPAALKYDYQEQAGAPRLKKIIDGVDTARFGELFYGGESQCQTPSGFDPAPLGYICAFRTYDGQVSNFYYKAAKLARVELPGGVMTDYAVDELGRLKTVRDSGANDAIAMGQRIADDSVLSHLSYDTIGRVSAIKMPSAQAGTNRQEHTLEYNFEESKRHITGAAAPNGYQQYLKYDNLQRTTKVCDIAALCDLQEWDAVKDLLLSSTDEAGLKSTSHYDFNDRVIESFGPAPTAWYGGDRKPLAAYVAQVPRSQTNYDEGINGLSINIYDNKKLLGAPKAFATGFNGATYASYGVEPTAGIVTPTDGLGIRATGKILLNEAGVQSFRAWHSGGMRLYIDNQIVIDEWGEGGERFSYNGTYNNPTPGRWVDYRIDVYTSGTAARVFAQLFRTPPGGGEQTAISHLLTPAYNLVTSTKSFDSTLGDAVSTTNYGARPEYGLAQSSTLDPTGLNYTSTRTFEAPGTAFLRQTSKTLPGGTVTNYAHYSATETRDNPCTTPVEALRQGGFMKLKTEADPDGTGPQTGRKTETVYNDAGQVVATRYNAEPWTCTTYDARGRVTQVIIPAFEGERARTITNNWAVDGNPLKVSSGDYNGYITTTSDLFGRTVNYVDMFGTWTGYEYDDLGNLTRRYGDFGEEGFVYNNLNRLIEQKFDGAVIAKNYYDALGRIDRVDYPAAGGLGLSANGRDDIGRNNSLTWRFSDGSTVNDRVTRSQSGQILTNTTQAGAHELSRTYGYDKASRLVSADIGPHTFRYGFGQQDASCAANANPNAGKNSNRTTQTVNGVTTTYCYDHADKLVQSSDALANNPQYDSRGNMKQLGTNATPLKMYYDSSDRSSGFEQYDGNGNGTGMYYDRDVQGRITSRYKNNIVNWDWQDAGGSHYGFTGSGDTPDLMRNDSWHIVEKYIPLPGGALLTLRPTEPQAANKAVYSLPNMHGDTMLTANVLGANTSTGNGPANSFAYDPFGNLLPGGNNPSNHGNAAYGYVGKHQKTTEVLFAQAPIQMGARVYLTTIGRFSQVDLVEGGVENNYVYPPDPVNKYDLTGQFAMFIIPAAMLAIKIAPYVPRAMAVGRQFFSNPRIGQAAHAGFSNATKKLGGFGNQASLPGSKLRPDGHLANRIMELKPHNLKAISRGVSQLNTYRKVAGDKFRYELWTYTKTWYGTFKYRCIKGCR